MLLFVIAAIFVSCQAKTVYITVKENVTQSCPHVKSNLVDQDSVKFSFDMISSSDGKDQAFITDMDGKTRSISFPACYKARISFRVNTPLKNPYIEAFLQLGQNIQCQGEGQVAQTDVCANITKTNWCPQSTNAQLRSFLEDKQTCQFCHLCETLKTDTGKEISTAKKYIFNEGSDTCETDEGLQTLSFKMCTPSKKELNAQQGDDRDKLEQYWHYLKQGVLTAVVHVMDRSEAETSKLAQCQKMCATLQERKSVSQSYKTTLLKTIEKLCTPKDEYAACIYHTMKFDLDGDF